MPPPASILIPTRRRRDYLAVALGSIAAQAAQHGAEVIVVEDDPADPETERLAAAHGARYLAIGTPRGLNIARNAAVDAAGGELLCFLDDDVEAWPGWLAALPGAAGDHPGHEAFGGPIRARLEGTNLHACGREPPPVTTLDLGPADTDAELVWGANMTLRRRALERVGRFDPGLGGAGDEEDWQRRLRASGGRILYVAAAGVDHRRTGADARIGRLARAALHRGRYARRYDAHKGTAPSVARELRTLAGCVWHTGRYACGNGIVLTALTAGRLREALAPRPVPPSLNDPDYLSGRSGTLGRRTRLAGMLRDRRAAPAALRRRRTLARAARSTPRRRVLVVSIVRPENARRAARAAQELERSHHEVVLTAVPPTGRAGKWVNLNAALPHGAPRGFDWLVIVDDDIVLPRDFLDVFIALAERYHFRLAQPAHAFASHAAWEITRRRPGVLARRTRLVEIGPVTAIRADAFHALLPFPDLQMGWGLDAHWGALAARHGWPIGVIDATPIRHTRPVAADYPREAAMAEAAAFLAGKPYVTRDEAAEVLAEYRDLQ
ncbi:MAG TPA: glycosyltransferase [Solirubrobacteraceae bacterium]|nr:glycosyltransferase [Solirubrobacteraceae bacterium]